MSAPSKKEILIYLGDRILEQPELLIEEQSSFPCPCCGKDFEEHTFEQMENCLGYDKEEGSL